jgi:hypothetical protein
MTPAQNTAAYIKGFEDGERATKAKMLRELESQEPVGWFVDFGDGDDASYCVVGGQEPKEPRAIVRPLFFHPLQRTEHPAWFPAVENILNEYGLQAIDFVADFKAAMKDAEQPQRTWVGLTDDEIIKMLEMKEDGTYPYTFDVVKEADAKLKEKNNA